MMALPTFGSSARQLQRGAQLPMLQVHPRARLLKRVGAYAVLLALSGSLPVASQTLDWLSRRALEAHRLGTPRDAGTRPPIAALAGLSGAEWVQRDKLVTPFGPQDNEFGEVVAVDGDTALVLSCSSPDGASFHVYARSGDLWSEQAILTPYPEETVCGLFFPGQIALDGNLAAITSYYPLDLEPPCRVGEVVIYSRTGESWSEQAVIAPGPSEGFGPRGMSLSGDTLVRTGGLIDEANGCGQFTDTFAVVSVRSGNDWIEQARLMPPKGGTFDVDQGGTTVVDGDTLAILGENAAQERVVYVFMRDGTAWFLQAELSPSDGAPRRRYGYSVDVSGDTVVIGAPREGGEPPLPLGKVYVYTRSGETWSEQAQLTAPVPDGEDGNFSRSLSLDGDTLLVGARGIGAAFVFNRSGVSWDVAGTLTPADEAAFAYDVALSGDTAIIGTNDASIFDPNPFAPGWAYLFDTRPPAPTIRLDPSVLDFEATPVGQASDVLTMTLENNGGAGLEVGTLALNGGHPNDFELVADPCSGQVIEPGDPCSVELRFAPTAIGNRQALLEVPSNAPTGLASAVLSGEGLEGPPTVRWDPHELSAVLTPDDASDEVLELSNLGTSELAWDVLSGDGPGLAEPLRPRRQATVFATNSYVSRADPSSRLATGSGEPRVVRPSSPGDAELGSQTVTVTHSQSTEIVIPNTPRCVLESSGFTVANQFLRTFTLADFGIVGDFDVTEVAFGVESLTAEIDIAVNLYILDGVLLIRDNMTLLSSGTVTLSPQEGTLVTVPLSTTVPAGATIVMEVSAPSMVGIGSFTAGSNSAGQFAPSYFSTPGCGAILDPIRFEDLGFPDVDLVMSVTGSLDCDLPSWLAVDPMSGTVAGRDSATVTATFDSSGLSLGEYGANLCLAANDPAKPFVIVPATLSVVDEVIPPVADISPTEIELTIGRSMDSDTQTLTIGNLGTAGPLEWSLLTAGGEGCYDPDEVPWLTVGPMSGSVAPGGTQSLSVTASGVLHDNGPLINLPDAGTDGADLSMLESRTLGMSSTGFNVGVDDGFRGADDFEIAEESEVTAVTFYVYQTGSPLASTIDRVSYQVWDGPPGDPQSTVVFGDTTSNRLLSTDWTGAYRVFEEVPLSTLRPIMSVTADGGFNLPPGSYWVDAWFAGDENLTGPWQPPVAILGEDTTGNALLWWVGDDLWLPALDPGSQTPQGMPFLVHGLPTPLVGTRETTLCFSTNDPETPQVNVPVSLTVTGADLGFEPSSLEFGDVQIGSVSPPQTALLQNVGNVAVSGLGFELETGDFVVDTTACASTLPVGGSCEVEVRFSPVQAGSVEETLLADSAEGGTGILSLSGNGVAIPPPTLELAPGSLDVELVSGETTVESLTISNSGVVTLDWEIKPGGEAAGQVLKPKGPTTEPEVRPTRGIAERRARLGRTGGEEGDEEMASHPFPTPASGEVTLTHSESLDVLAHHTVLCTGSNNTFENNFLRTFTLSDFDITSDFAVTEVTFGIQRVTTTVTVAVNLYTLEGEFIYDNLTPIATATAELTPQALTLVTVPVTGTAPAGSTLVVEIATPSLFGEGEFSLGSNDLGETADSYLSTTTCGLPEPTPYRQVPPLPQGNPDVHLVMTVTGTTECALPGWAGALPTSGSVPGGEEQPVDVTFDATQLAPGGYAADLCVASNDPDRPLVQVPLTLTVAPAVVLTFDPMSLAFGNVDVGDTSAPLSATLHNDGVAAATGLTFDLGDAAFAVDAGNCGESLPAGASCTVSVTFSPVDAGPAAATLQVAGATGASAELGLTGNGVDAGVVTPIALEVDPEVQISDGNGVFEPGELVIAAPWWRNDGLLPKSLTGTTSELVGPEEVPHSVEEGSADYGTLQPGESGSCLDTDSCYLLLVGDPSARPMTHWDARFAETLDDTLNTSKTWTVHIGGSFADVSKSSLFYSSIETLLHSGITGGCTASEYCPGGVNSRSQMPVFMLRALEGPDYTPPACDPGEERLFSDVPADHLFCPWIEELHRRELISGCGGGAYCPGAPVTRAQMAVFLLRALEGADYSPPECSGQFADVPCPSLFADWIEELATREITSGCTETSYCANDPVTRAQMAVFITRTFGLTLYGP